jgi:hypothetical protein
MPNAMAHSSMVVPRSGSSITRNARNTVSGTTGTSRCRTSPSSLALRVSTSAENSSSASLANSAGCTVTPGATEIQRVAPEAVTAPGWTSTNSRPRVAPTSSGAPSRRQRR